TTAVPVAATKNLFFHTAQFGGLGDFVSCHTKIPTNAGVTWAGGFFNHKDSAGQALTSCMPCHTSELPKAFIGTTRIGFNHDPTYGTDCVSCHTTVPGNIGVAWKAGFFGHNANMSGTFKSCSPCHDTYRHRAGTNCANCHNNITWPRPSTNGVYRGSFGGA
ncbi:MAG: hypothetical protein AABZ55_13920, partial [Bdellovibrionota bacterium]